MNASTPIFARIALMTALLSASITQADLLLTTDGRILDGTVRIEGDTFILTDRSNAITRIDASRLFALRMTSNAPVSASRSITLRSGTVIPIDQFIRGDGKLLRVTRPKPVDVALLDVPYNELAEIRFSGAQSVQWPAGDMAGVLLASGDFYQGEVTDLTADRLVVTSPLFGPRTFNPATDVIAARIGPISPIISNYFIRLANQTASRSTSLRAEQGRLTFNDPILRAQAVPLDQVREVISPGRTTPIDLGEVSTPLRGTPPWQATHRVSTLPPQAPLTLDIPPQATALYLRFTPPPTQAPTRSLRLTIQLDSSPPTQSTPTHSAADPLLIGIPVQGKTRITLSSPSGTVLLSDAIWVHP